MCIVVYIYKYVQVYNQIHTFVQQTLRGGERPFVSILLTLQGGWKRRAPFCFVWYSADLARARKVNASLFVVIPLCVHFALRLLHCSQHCPVERVWPATEQSLISLGKASFTEASLQYQNKNHGASVV